MLSLVQEVKRLSDWLPVGVHVMQGCRLDITGGAGCDMNMIDACTSGGELIALN